MRFQKNSAGFTLIEIILILLILGLLAGIAVPNFSRARSTARSNICINNLRMIASAKDLSGLEFNLVETSTPTTDQLSAYLKAGVVPNEPLSGASSSYTINAISANPTCAYSAAPDSHVLS